MDSGGNMERNDFGNSSFQPGFQGGMSQVIARAEEARLEAVKSKEIIESLIADYENIMIVNLDTDEMSIYEFDDRYSEYFGLIQIKTVPNSTISLFSKFTFRYFLLLKKSAV